MLPVHTYSQQPFGIVRQKFQQHLCDCCFEVNAPRNHNLRKCPKLQLCCHLLRHQAVGTVFIPVRALLYPVYVLTRIWHISFSFQKHFLKDEISAGLAVCESWCFLHSISNSRLKQDFGRPISVKVDVCGNTAANIQSHVQECRG